MKQAWGGVSPADRDRDRGQYGRYQENPQERRGGRNNPNNVDYYQNHSSNSSAQRPHPTYHPNQHNPNQQRPSTSDPSSTAFKKSSIASKDNGNNNNELVQLKGQVRELQRYLRHYHFRTVRLVPT